MSETVSTLPERSYVDCGVQTDASLDPLANNLSLEQPYSAVVEHVPDAGFLSFDDGPALPGAYIERKINPNPAFLTPKPQLPQNRPTDYHHPKSKSNEKRVVSLPESVPLLTSLTVEKTNARIVSNPETKAALALNASFELNSASLSSGDASYLADQESSNSCIFIMNRDAPRTPSPASFEPIAMADEGRLPREFLRHKERGSKEGEECIANDGWIAWAESPPKPIPALHGPLSLPYARCPSGAEGTVIEGQGELPRIIWGLGANERQAPARALNIRHALRTQDEQGNVESPLTDVQSPEVEQLVTPSLATNLGTIAGNVDSISSHQSAAQEDRNSTLIWTPSMDAAVPQIAAGNFMPVNLQRGAIDLRTGLGLQWKDSLQKINRPYSFGIPGDPRDGISLPLQDPNAYLRNAIGPRPEQRVHDLPSRRLSAMELAQQFRDRQEALSELRSPRDTASPQWSPDFSSYNQNYQEPPSSPRITTLPPRFQNQNRLDYLESLISERLRNTGLGLRSGQVDVADGTLAGQPLNPCLYGSFSELFGGRQGLGGYSQAGQSPMRPGPPPSSPLPPLPTYGPTTTAAVSAARNKANATNEFIDHPFVAASPPSSPEAPLESRRRTLSYQQPRSIPLAKLIRRRLSSVPEEEISGFLDRSGLFKVDVREDGAGALGGAGADAGTVTTAGAGATTAARAKATTTTAAPAAITATPKAKAKAATAKKGAQNAQTLALPGKLCLARSGAPSPESQDGDRVLVGSKGANTNANANADAEARLHAGSVSAAKSGEGTSQESSVTAVKVGYEKAKVESGGRRWMRKGSGGAQGGIWNENVLVSTGGGTKAENDKDAKAKAGEQTVDAMSTVVAATNAANANANGRTRRRRKKVKGASSR